MQIITRRHISFSKYVRVGGFEVQDVGIMKHRDGPYHALVRMSYFASFESDFLKVWVSDVVKQCESSQTLCPYESEVFQGSEAGSGVNLKAAEMAILGGQMVRWSG